MFMVCVMMVESQQIQGGTKIQQEQKSFSYVPEIFFIRSEPLSNDLRNDQIDPKDLSKELSSQKQKDPFKDSDPTDSKVKKSSNQNNEIQWPKDDTAFRIYSITNSHVVIDIAQTQERGSSLIMYKWLQGKNQQFYFELSHDNLYYIRNGRFWWKKYLTQSSKNLQYQRQTLTLLTFSSQKQTLWELIPYKQIPNSFYIVNSGKAVDFLGGQTFQGTDLVLRQFSKRKNQVWVLKEAYPDNNGKTQSEDEYNEQISQAMYDMIDSEEVMYESFKVESLKEQMKENYMELPRWAHAPESSIKQNYDLPPQMNSFYFAQIVNRKHKNFIKNRKIPLSSDAQKEKTKIQEKRALKSEYLAVECAKRNTIAYVWLGNKQMPVQYKYLLQKCKDNVLVLTDDHFLKYSKMWNSLDNVIKIEEKISIRLKVNILKLLYLYFESGIYADFDTQINEECWEEVYADEIVFTNRIDDDRELDSFLFPVQQIVLPEENFMMIREKFHPQVERMINGEMSEWLEDQGDRWRQCKYRQCLIVSCQRHYRDNTYLRGYD